LIDNKFKISKDNWSGEFQLSLMPSFQPYSPLALGGKHKIKMSDLRLIAHFFKDAINGKLKLSQCNQENIEYNGSCRRDNN
jgi:hypothetical protein